MAYAHDGGRPSYRSSALDEVQGYADLQLIWGSLRQVGRGKREPLKQEVMDKIVFGLKRTVNESKCSRTRIVASAIVLAIADEDWERDVYRVKKRK